MNTKEPLSRLLPALACGAALCSTARAQTTLYTIPGDKTNDRLGISARSAGDTNNDGRPDFIAGGPEDNNFFFPGEGLAKVYSGATGLTLRTFNGVTIGDGFGYAVAGLGDLNNDSFDDLAVGAPFVVNAGTVRGAVTVFSGQTGGVLGTIFGPAANDQIGSAVAAAGDVNNDGTPDLIVGAAFSPNGGNQRGKAVVYSGVTGAVIWTINGTADGERRGIDVDGVGDLNGDSFDDFVVGSYVGAKVFSGFNGLQMFEVVGLADDKLGVAVAGAGDVNGDTVPDVIVGAPQDLNVFVPGTGYARIVSGLGGALIVNLPGAGVGDRFGCAVGAAGDVNGDSRADVLVAGDQATGVGNGYVRLYSGLNGQIIHTVAGQAFDDRFGTAVDGLGDVNNDGKADFIVGAPSRDVPDVANGEVTVFSVGANCPLPVNYCSATPNSLGVPGKMGFSGTTSIAANNLVVTVSQIPPNAFNIYIMSLSSANIPMANGFRCVGDPFFRIGQQNATPQGTGSMPVNLNGFGPPVSSHINPGEHLYFSNYYRNAAAGGANANLADGLDVTLCP